MLYINQLMEEKIGKKLMIKEVLGIVHFTTLIFLLTLKMKIEFIVFLPTLMFLRMGEEALNN